MAVKERERGYDEATFVESFVILNAAGGECVDDFGHLRSDAGLAELIGHELPSAEAARKFLNASHEEEKKGSTAAASTGYHSLHSRREPLARGAGASQPRSDSAVGGTLRGSEDRHGRSRRHDYREPVYASCCYLTDGLEVISDNTLVRQVYITTLGRLEMTLFSLLNWKHLERSEIAVKGTHEMW